MYSNLEEKFAILKAIAQKHNMDVASIESIELAWQNLQNQKLNIPLIGKFSTGKSALLNAIINLNNKLLREDITPETAVPTEISYNDTDYFAAHYQDSEQLVTYSAQEYRSAQFDFNVIEKTIIKLRSEHLKEFKDIVLVDMPGYESGYDVHNKAIDSYLPQSMVYVLVFAAEDTSLKNYIIDTSKEIIANDKPICIVITKSDKVSEDILEANLAKLKSDLEKRFTNSDFHYCITSVYKEDIKEFQEFLRTMQGKTHELIMQKYITILLPLAKSTEKYLEKLIENQHCTISELTEQEAKLQDELQSIKSELAKDSDELQKLVLECIEHIKDKIRTELNNEVNTMVAMLMNDKDIKEKVNNIVRLAVTNGIKEHFVPSIQKYLTNISHKVDVLTPTNVDLLLANFKVKTNSMTNNIVTSTVAAITLFVFGLFPALFIALFTWVNKKKQEQERQRQKVELTQKLQSEIFPQIIEQVGSQLAIELTKEIHTINQTIEKELNDGYNRINGALNELIRQKETEDKDQAQKSLSITEDIQTIKELINEYARDL